MDAPSVPPKKPGYNERIFGSGLRRAFHLGRFHWASKAAARDTDLSKVVELGCFDGRLLDYLPREPAEYVGIDADWEGGLSAAKQKFAGRSDRIFLKASEPSIFQQFKDRSFTSAFALETLEHVPPHLVDPYLQQLARVLHGRLFVTVPNEKGPVFLAKWTLKKALYGDGERYRAHEVCAATLGLLGKVERNQHKGFDYHALARQIGRYFDDVRLTGLPGGVAPPFLSMTVAIIAKSRDAPCAE